MEHDERPAIQKSDRKIYKSRFISFDGEHYNVHLAYKFTVKEHSERKEFEEDEKKSNIDSKIEMFDIRKLTN